MSNTDGFYTFKGYQLHADSKTVLSIAMEDYLEMICRMTADGQQVRVSDLSKHLHVSPSSVTKMIQHLNKIGYINSQKYGTVHLTDKGKETGDYLLYRHDVMNRFLCILNNSEDELEQAEKIEHFLNRNTVENLDKLIKNMLRSNFMPPW